MEEKAVVEPEVQSIPESPLAKLGIDEKRIITSKRCLICKSKVRVQVEAMHEKAEPISEICRVLADAGDAVVPRQVLYHFQAHYDSVVTELAKVEYAESLGEMVKRHRAMSEDTESLIAMGWKELFRVAVLDTNGSIDKEHQRQKMIVEYMTSIRESLELLKSLQDGDARYEAAKDKFVKVWTLKINEAKDENVKGALIATLKDFQEKLGQA